MMTKKELEELIEEGYEIAPMNMEEQAEQYALEESGYTETDWFEEMEQ